MINMKLKFDRGNVKNIFKPSVKQTRDRYKQLKLEMKRGILQLIIQK